MDREAVREVFLPRREDGLESLRKKRWKEGVKCPYCGSSKIGVDGHTLKGARKYECCGCGRYFNDLTGTIFENHHFPIEEMFYILKEMEAKSTLLISEEWGRDYDSLSYPVVYWRMLLPKGWGWVPIVTYGLGLVIGLACGVSAQGRERGGSYGIASGDAGLPFGRI
jgi:hypothetical protein